MPLGPRQLLPQFPVWSDATDRWSITISRGLEAAKMWSLVIFVAISLESGWSLRPVSTPRHMSPAPPASPAASAEKDKLSVSMPSSLAATEQQLVNSYSALWQNLLQREYQDTAAELRQRRKTYTRLQLESSGLAIFSATATPESELYGEKIVRVTVDSVGDKKLRNRFKAGDTLLITPQISFRYGRIIRKFLASASVLDYACLSCIRSNSSSALALSGGKTLCPARAS